MILGFSTTFLCIFHTEYVISVLFIFLVIQSKTGNKYLMMYNDTDYYVVSSRLNLNQTIFQFNRNSFFFNRKLFNKLIEECKN